MPSPLLTDMRSELLSVVERMPGITCSELAERLDVDHSTASYHLRRLAKARLISPHAVGRTVRFYAAGCGICPFLRKALPALRDPANQEIVSALEGQPARLMDLAAPSDAARIRGRLERLAGLGILEKRNGRWIPSPETAVCRDRARGTGTCDLWGRCAVSRRWRQADAESAPL